jgi:hypothetical protein
MTAIESFPGPSGVVDSIELRKNLAGLIVRSTSGSPRAGVFPRNASPLVSATAATGPMTVDVSAFEAALVRQGGPLFMQNDGTVSVTIGTAPVSNSRIDVVYVRQNESAAPMSDGSNTPVIAVVAGTAAATPVKPTIPVGALELATVTVPSGVTSTNAVGVVITQTFPCTAASGGLVRFRDQAEQDGFVATAGTLGYRADTGVHLKSSGTGWVPLFSRGTWTGATNVDGLVVIGHGLGVVPSAVVVTMRSIGVTDLVARIMDVRLYDKTTTQFYVRNFRRDTNAWFQDYISFDWIAIP